MSQKNNYQTSKTAKISEKFQNNAENYEETISKNNHNANKLEAFETARSQIEKQFGKGSLIRMGDESLQVAISTIPTGSLLLDEALGVGGYPRGRIVEIYGPESSGKTTLALHAIAEAQKQGGIAAFIDAEHALDPSYARNLGLDVDNLWLSQPDSGEQALEIVDQLVRSGSVDIIVIDSVAALTPQVEIDGDMGDSHIGLQARLMSQALRKLTSIISKQKTCLIFINQTRVKIGMRYGGNPETTSGGNALKFYASQRLEVRRGETIMKSPEEIIGSKVLVKIVKNKLAPPFKKAELEIIYGKGISATASLLDSAVNHRLVNKSGSWFSYGDEKMGQGREAAKQYLDDNIQISLELNQKLRAMLFEKSSKSDPVIPHDAPLVNI